MVAVTWSTLEPVKHRECVCVWLHSIPTAYFHILLEGLLTY